MRVFTVFFGRLDDLGDLLDGLVVIVGEIVDFTVLPRHLRDAAPQLRVALRAENRLFGRVGSVSDHFRRGLVKLAVPASTERRESFESRDRQDPGRNLRSAFERTGLPPHAEEDFADNVFGGAGIGEETGKEAVTRILCRRYSVRMAA
jgi:hypothetical protein